MVCEQARLEWRTFVDKVNWDQPHALGWERFYAFVIGVHRKNGEPSLREFGGWLEATSAEPEARRAFYLAYDVGLELLAQYERADSG